MRKDLLEWEFQNEKHRHPGGINVEPIKNYVLLTSLFVPNAMNLYFHTMFVPIVAFIKGKK